MNCVRKLVLRGELRENEPMSRHTSWRVGGPADRFYRPADIADLALFISQLAVHEPLYWLGLGSNLLVRDGGLRGTVICTTGRLNRLQKVSVDQIRVDAGVPCGKVARFSARHGLRNADFLVGIPGTMGGALAMNAGAFGGEIWKIVDHVETLDRMGQTHKRSAHDYDIGYRQTVGPDDEWFVSALLKLDQDNSGKGLATIKQLLERRNMTQPVQQPSAGSVFRNPAGDFSARLIEAAGLKGVCVGNACVSEKHANFIVNTGGASATQIEALMAKVAETVRKKLGVELVKEVHVIGDPVT